MGDKEWMIKVNDEVKHMMEGGSLEIEVEHWKKVSIYKLPACLRDLNEKAYQPRTVSFGPYHNGEEKLKPMEEHKHRALLHFLKRSSKTLDFYFDSLSQVVQPLKDSYDSLDHKWQANTEAFLQLMILDGCFMLEILKAATETVDDYAPKDPIFSSHGKLYIMPYIKRDMLMLENQLPMLLLTKLLAADNKEAEQDEEFTNKLIQKFCFPNTSVRTMGKCLHVLDVYRKRLVWQEKRDSKKKTQCGEQHSAFSNSKGGDEIIRSATELNEAGIRFKKSKTASLTDISFKHGVLRLPLIVVDDAIESMFLNLMAFERFHVGAGNDITSYIFFMDNIIDNARDVSLLHSYGIIQNALGSDKAVAKLFNSISEDITLDPESSLDLVRKKVSAYCKKRRNEWRANLIHTYFRNPWALLSVLAAVFLFALTIIQTIYSVYSYYQPNDSSTPPPPPDHVSLSPQLSPSFH